MAALLDLLTVTLEAHNREKNHHRHYEVTVDLDLLSPFEL
jgi:hypothetical protein